MQETDTETIAGKSRPSRKVAGQDPTKRAQILAGAKRCFIKLGYEAASMNEITAEAGVSKGTIYVYFADKQSLFRALIESEKSAAMEVLRRDLEKAKSVDEALTTFGRTVCMRMNSDDVIRAQRMVLGVLDSQPETAGIFYGNQTSTGPTVLADYLQAQVEAGLLDIADVDLAAHQFADLAMSTIYKRRLFGNLCNAPGRHDIEHVVESAVEMFLARYGKKAD
jgi:AcrR family transcriptional regulator